MFFINNGPLIDGIDAGQFRQSLPMSRMSNVQINGCQKNTSWQVIRNRFSCWIGLTGHGR